MMKRFLAALCAAILLMGMVACGKNADADKDDDAENESSAEEATMEEVFDKAFEAAKVYDVDAMCEVDYVINFKKNTSKEEMKQKIVDQINALPSETIEKIKEAYTDTTYVITEKEELSEDELSEQVKLLDELYRDTDKITNIVSVKYQVDVPYADAVNDQYCAMIKVDGKWYRYLSDDAWNFE